MWPNKSLYYTDLLFMINSERQILREKQKYILLNLLMNQMSTELGCDWGTGSVVKMFAVQAWGPKFNPPGPMFYRSCM